MRHTRIFERHPAEPFAEGAIRLTVSGGAALLGAALLVGAGLAGLLGLGVTLIGCAMSEANFYRRAYRVKPHEDA